MSTHGLPELLNYNVTIADQVARIELVYHARSRAIDRGLVPADPHWELFELMNHLRTDNTSGSS